MVIDPNSPVGRAILQALSEGRATEGPRAVVPVPAPALAVLVPNTVRPVEGIPPPVMVAVELVIPVRLVSEANAHDKLGAKLGRKAAVKAAVRAALELATPPPLPVVVTLTRLGGKALDADDNLPRALKAVKDVVAAWLAVADTGRDPRVKWRLRQAAAYSAGCRVRVESKGERL